MTTPNPDNTSEKTKIFNISHMYIQLTSSAGLRRQSASFTVFSNPIAGDAEKNGHMSIKQLNQVGSVGRFLRKGNLIFGEDDC